MSPLRIIFMGTPQFACPTLRMLIDRGENIVAAVTQPDRPKGRGQLMQQPPVKALAEQYGIPVLQPLKVRASEAIEEIRACSPDLIVVIAFGQILPKALLDIPRYGCINVHASLLPRYRGAAPINWCIINGETETGITTMMMDVGLDTGDMLLKKEIPIFPEDTASTLHDRLSVLGAEAMSATLDLLKEERLSPEKQDDSLSCYSPMLKKELGEIRWDSSGRSIINLVRGVNPWPGAYTKIDGRVLKVHAVRLGSSAGAPGEILATGKDGIEAACADGSIIIEEMQLEGKKRLKAVDFLAGCRIDPGSIFS
jgi:methionyl-tRNA formyltransferase